MKNYIIKESNEYEVELIIDKLVDYNLSIVPQVQEQPFIMINRVVKNYEDKIIAGINSKIRSLRWK